jgi:Flp pilus assembly protein TadG
MKKHIKILLSLGRANEGGVLIMVGVFILIIFAIGGAGIDFGRAQLLQMKEQQASDAAALAAANILDKDTTNPNEATIREDAARRYYNLNFPTNYLGVARTTPQYSFDKASGDIIVSNSENIKTNYITTMGRSDLTVAARTKVNIPNKNIPDFDVVMVIDESGSTRIAIPTTGRSRIETERAAVSSMIDVLFPVNQPPNPNLRFGLTGHSGAMTHAFGLTSDKSQAQTYIDSLDWYNQTYTHWGMEAGFNMISGVWNGFVPPSQCGVHNNPLCVPQRNTGVPAAVTERDDGARLSRARYVVFITDGFIMVQPAPCRGGAGDFLPGDTCPNYRAFLRVCDSIKAPLADGSPGAIIYTINFASQSPGDVAPMTACASDSSKYFYAPDGPTLQGILTGIATKINKVRITD